MLARPSDALGGACSDGVDNDGDGKIDYPADPGCAHSDDTSEGPTCPPLASGVMVCLMPGSLFGQYDIRSATTPPTGPEHHVAAWIDQYRFKVADVTTTLSCVQLAVDATGVNPCAQAGGFFVRRVATLIDQTRTQPVVQIADVVTVEVCNAELTVTAAGNGIDSAPVFALC